MKVTYLFGAGCEVYFPYNLPTGIQFFNETYFGRNPLNYHKKFFIDNHFTEYTSHIMGDYYQARFIVQNTIQHVLSKNKSKDIDLYYNTFETLDLIKRNNLFYKFFLALFHSNKEYRSLYNLLNNDEKKLINILISDIEAPDLSLFEFNSSLDEKFHSIINPKKYGVEIFNKIFNYYWNCFFAVYERNTLDIEAFKENIPKHIRNYYKENGRILEGSYYDYIQKTTKDYTLAGVITTNYTPFCNSLCDEDNIAFLNGKLHLFEFPETLEVIDALDIENDSRFEPTTTFFPFIFGQSFVKPIVHPFQMNEFSKTKKILSQTNILVILGYNVNSDDNHVNVYLKDFIKANRKNKIVYVSDEVDYVNEKKVSFLSPVERMQIIWLKVKYQDGAEHIVNEIHKKIKEHNLKL